MSAISARKAAPTPLAADGCCNSGGPTEAQTAKVVDETAQTVRAESGPANPPPDESQSTDATQSAAENAPALSTVGPSAFEKEREETAARIRQSSALPPHL